MTDLLSTGSTLVNLANSGDPFGGFMKGKYVFFVGDSSSGKTVFCLSCFAEACINPAFADYRLIYDAPEDGCLFDIDKLFGERVADKIEPPATTKDGEAVYSETTEDFYYNLDDAIAAGKPFIYVLDSMDSLDAEADNKKFKQQKMAARKRSGAIESQPQDKEEKVSGSYGMAKAKKNSEGLRKARRGLKATGSILIVISQTRDDPTAMYSGAKTRAGGRALRFYADNEIWTRVCGQIKKKVMDKDRVVGARIGLKWQKNRITGKLHEVQVDFYPDYGIDDLGSCVDYLTEEGYWPVEKQTITCRGLDSVAGTRDKVIRVIEKRGLENEVRKICGVCWKEIDEATQLKRKARYSDVEVGTD